MTDLHIGHVKLISAFQYSQNVQIHIILHTDWLCWDLTTRQP